MITEHEATARVVACDFPRCFEQTTSYLSKPVFHTAGGSEGWVDVRFYGDRIVSLCPSHAHHADTVKLLAELLNGTQ